MYIREGERVWMGCGCGSECVRACVRPCNLSLPLSTGARPPRLPLPFILLPSDTAVNNSLSRKQFARSFLRLDSRTMQGWSEQQYHLYFEMELSKHLPSLRLDEFCCFSSGWVRYWNWIRSSGSRQDPPRREIYFPSRLHGEFKWGYCFRLFKYALLERFFGWINQHMFPAWQIHTGACVL